MKLGISIEIDIFNQKASGNFKTVLKKMLKAARFCQTDELSFQDRKVSGLQRFSFITTPFLSKFINMFLWAKLTKQHIYRLLHLELQIFLHPLLIHNVHGQASSAFPSPLAMKLTGKAPAEWKSRARWRRWQTGATHASPVGSCSVVM